MFIQKLQSPLQQSYTGSVLLQISNNDFGFHIN